MKTKILMILALFFMLSGFNGEDRIVEENGVNLRKVVNSEYFGPTIIEKPKILTASDGSEIVIKVLVKADPKPTVTWSKNSIVIKESTRCIMRVILESAGVYVATLTIKEPTIMDYGKYKVHFENDFGEAAANIDL